MSGNCGLRMQRSGAWDMASDNLSPGVCVRNYVTAKNNSTGFRVGRDH
ncbi:MAG: hypothetical protein ACJA0W_003430, partial [Candidatus Azotimanducaceae bacterium]